MILENEWEIGLLIEKRKKLMRGKGITYFGEKHSILMEGRKGELWPQMEGRVLE